MWQYFSVDLINMNDKVICEFVCCHSIMAGMLCNKMYNFFVYHTIWFWLWFQWDNSSDNRQNPVPVRFQKIESVTSLFPPPFPQMDIIGAVVIVWRVRGKTIRSVGPISLCLDSFLHVLCVLLYTVCMCRFVTR